MSLSTRLLTAAFLLVLNLGAQRRFDVTPLFGYRGTEAIPAGIQTLEGQSSGKLKFAPGTSFGLAAGLRYEGLNVIEFQWMRRTTDATYTGSVLGQPILPASASIDQFHGDFTREYELEDRRMMRPYIIGSIGATRVKTPLSEFTRMSFGLGGGVKVFPKPRFGFRLQAQWLPLWLNPKVEGFVCGGGCIVVLGGRLANQFEVSLGPVFSF